MLTKTGGNDGEIDASQLLYCGKCWSLKEERKGTEKKTDLKEGGRKKK